MYWKARRFPQLSQLPDDQFFAQLEIGLTLVAQNAAALMDAALALFDVSAAHARSSHILASHARDEAGKFLMLLDAARCPRSQLPQHLKRATRHLPRLLYAETTQLSPATFAELRNYLDAERQSHYLDGPDGHEWVFRNSTIYWREQALYVDRTEGEDGTVSWQDPDYYDRLLGFRFRPNAGAVEHVIDLRDLGMHVAPALLVIARRWRDFVPGDDTRRSDMESLNRATLDELTNRGLIRGSAEQQARVSKEWTFPLWGVDCDEQEMNLADLRG